MDFTPLAPVPSTPPSPYSPPLRRHDAQRWLADNSSTPITHPARYRHCTILMSGLIRSHSSTTVPLAVRETTSPQLPVDSTSARPAPLDRRETELVHPIRGTRVGIPYTTNRSARTGADGSPQNIPLGLNQRSPIGGKTHGGLGRSLCRRPYSLTFLALSRRTVVRYPRLVATTNLICL